MSLSPKLRIVSALAITMCSCGPKKAKEAEDSVLSDEPATIESTTSDSDSDSGEGEANADVIKVADLAYTLPAGVDTRLATIDLFRFDDDIARPLVVLVHGGSWVGGDKSNFELAAPAFVPWWTDRGYTVAAVNFRLATPYGSPLEVGPKDQASDIAHAVSWLLAEGSALGVASEPAVLVGFSSGAHLVALLGADASYLTAAGASADAIRATISLDVHAYDVPYALELMVDSDVEENIPLIEHLFGSTESEQRSASPIAFTDTPTAPALLVSVGPRSRTGSHGDIVYRTAENYADALFAAGYTVETFHDEDENHDSLAIGFGESGDPSTAAAEAFLAGLP